MDKENSYQFKGGTVMKSVGNTTCNHFAKKDNVFGIRITKLVHNCLDVKQHHVLYLPFYS